MKKKIFALLVAASMVAGLVACGSQPAAETPAAEKTEAEAPAEEPKTEEAEEPAAESTETVKLVLQHPDYAPEALGLLEEKEAAGEELSGSNKWVLEMKEKIDAMEGIEVEFVDWVGQSLWIRSRDL